ncbi:MAG: hypothetical protein QME28_09095 [Candidatus Saccharicenans sp.]|nr:hypothetical protein [Candidatus Saccharicenans sp.]
MEKFSSLFFFLLFFLPDPGIKKFVNAETNFAIVKKQKKVFRSKRSIASIEKKCDYAERKARTEISAYQTEI